MSAMSAAPSRRTPLAERIASLIEATGPIGIADYFSICLSDPEHGYYMRREPFGRGGDFVTAPEVTQLFGEMIGIFLVDRWARSGRQAPVRLIEIGPGRGTLMSDALRVVARLAPDMKAATSVHLVETSPRLAAAQRATLAASGFACSWHDTLEAVPAGHALIVANELFDALPLRQFVKLGADFRERVVALDATGNLVFSAGARRIDPAMLPADADRQPEGTIFETAPAREAVMRLIAERLTASGGMATIIDYGHTVSGYGDTLQALKDHAFDDPLAHPGEADLTSHVDFEALAGTAKAAGATVAALTHQGDFLLGLGLVERAGRLGTGKSAAEQDAIRAAVERIAGTGPGNMGELFKVLVVTDGGNRAGHAMTIA
jgi:SAM-dependent MidA family methyltransferase